MVRCWFCGGLTHWIGGNLYKCYTCEQLTEDRKDGTFVAPQLKVFPRIERVRAAATEGMREVTMAVPSEQGLDREMVTFISRVASALTSTKGYEDDPEVLSRIMTVRQQYRQALTEVFEGKTEFQAWYDKTKTATGMHPTDFNRMLYDALEGLTSEEAIEMRKGYEALLKGSQLGI